MKRLASSRAAAAILALAAPAAALADTGSSISPAGWASLLAVPLVVGVLWVVHKRIG